MTNPSRKAMYAALVADSQLFDALCREAGIPIPWALQWVAGRRTLNRRHWNALQSALYDIGLSALKTSAPTLSSRLIEETLTRVDDAPGVEEVEGDVTVYGQVEMFDTMRLDRCPACSGEHGLVLRRSDRDDDVWVGACGEERKVVKVNDSKVRRAKFVAKRQNS